MVPTDGLRGAWRASQIGAPVILRDEEMDEVIEQFQHYGRRNGEAETQ